MDYKETIKQEIERRKARCERYKDISPSADACYDELNDILSFLDTLQEPEGCKIVPKPVGCYGTCNNCPLSTDKQGSDVDLNENIKWEWVHREKSEVDLIECAEMDKDEFIRVAKLFFNLGRQAKPKKIWHDASEPLPIGQVIVKTAGGGVYMGWTNDSRTSIEDEHGRSFGITVSKWCAMDDIIKED